NSPSEAPCLPNSRTVARPTPADAPVTTTTSLRDFSSISIHPVHSVCAAVYAIFLPAKERRHELFRSGAFCAMRGGLFRLFLIDARLIKRRLLAICEHHAS